MVNFNKTILITALIAFSILIVLLNTGEPVLTSKTIIQEKPVIKEYGPEIKVYFCQMENCSLKLIEYIKNATTIHCAFFDLDNKPIINALLNKKDVKIVLDDTSKTTYPYARTDNQNQLSHNKFCVFDSSIIWTGSQNPTDRCTYLNDNNAIVIESKTLAKNYEAEFVELWNGIYGRGYEISNPIIYFNDKKIENYFCPEDDCKKQVLKTLNSASESIYILAFSLTLDEIGDLLIKKNLAGLDIKGVFERTQVNKYHEFYKLNDSNISVKWDSNKYNMHHKVFIIDKKIVLTGSANPTQGGYEKNDENILIIHDETIANYYLREFNRIWNR